MQSPTTVSSEDEDTIVLNSAAVAAIPPAPDRRPVGEALPSLLVTLNQNLDAEISALKEQNQQLEKQMSDKNHGGADVAADGARNASAQKLQIRLQSLTQPLLKPLLKPLPLLILLLLLLLFVAFHRLTVLSGDKAALQSDLAQAAGLLREAKSHSLTSLAAAHENCSQVLRSVQTKREEAAVNELKQGMAALQLEANVLRDANAKLFAADKTRHEDYRQVREALELQLESAEAAVTKINRDNAALRSEAKQANLKAEAVKHLQHGSFIYATLHQHAIDKRDRIDDGREWRELPAGWDVAPGDDNDLRVCGAHAWQSSWLVFADGRRVGTGWWKQEEPSRVGKVSGKGGFLLRDGKKLSAQQGNFDVLLRKRV